MNINEAIKTVQRSLRCDDNQVHDALDKMLIVIDAAETVSRTNSARTDAALILSQALEL